MRRIYALSILMLAATLSSAWAEEKVPRVSVPPRLSTIGSVDLKQGELGLINHTVAYIFESDAHGQKHRKPVYESDGATIPLASADVYDASGKMLTDEEIFKRATVGSVVAISASCEQVDSAYLRALAKDTLVIVSPHYAVNYGPQRRIYAGTSATPEPFGQRLDPAPR